MPGYVEKSDVTGTVAVLVAGGHGLSSDTGYGFGGQEWVRGVVRRPWKVTGEGGLR